MSFLLYGSYQEITSLAKLSESPPPLPYFCILRLSLACVPPTAKDMVKTQSHLSEYKKYKQLALISRPWPRGYKTFFMLNSVEHEICPAHKC